MSRALRKALLKPGFAAVYPELLAGVWIEARAAAGVVAMRQRRELGPDVALSERVLPPAHFDFHGGRARGPRAAGMRTCLSDRPGAAPA